MLIPSKFSFLVKDIGEVTFAAVLPVRHSSHEDTSSALKLRLAASQSLARKKSLQYRLGILVGVAQSCLLRLPCRT
jgi:hypothetical protein